MSIFLEIFKYKTCITYIKHAEILARAKDTCPPEQKIVAVFCNTSLFCLFQKDSQRKGYQALLFRPIPKCRGKLKIRR